MASGPRMRRASGGRGVVLAHVDAVGADLEGEIGPVVEDEGHAEVAAHRRRHPGPGEQGPGVEVLVPELDQVDAAGDARGQEVGQVGPVGGAEVEPAPVEDAHPPATARTSSRRSPSTRVVVDR